MVKGHSKEGSGIRGAFSVLMVIVLVGLAAAPFLGKAGAPSHRASTDGHGADSSINGSMTLADVEQLTGIPSATILRELGLPGNLPTDEKLGRLRKEFRFEMQDVREVVQNNPKKTEKAEFFKPLLYLMASRCQSGHTH